MKFYSRLKLHSLNIRHIKIISLMLICLLSISLVFSLGVSSPYWENNPLFMRPGETKDVAFALVNPADAEIEIAYVTLDDGAGIAEIISGAEYTVIPGTTNTKIILRVTIPNNAINGTIYNVKFYVESTPEGNIGIRYNIEFPVIIEGIDNDSDGFLEPVDCNDNDSSINPNAIETCDLIDNNCNGNVDDVDLDNDGVNDCYDDRCLGTEFIGDVPIFETGGCSASQILECKPGKSKGQYEIGISTGTLNVFINQIGWAKDGCTLT